MDAKNDNIMPEKAHLGNITFYERDGQRLVRQRRGAPGWKNRTPEVAMQRAKYPNVLRAWRASKGAMRGLFEGKKAGQSDYNVFMSLNTKQARVLLPKGEAFDNRCVADNFVVSSGSLMPSVTVRETEDWFISDLAIGRLELSAETRLADLIAALESYNRGLFRFVDRLTFLRFKQIAEGVNGYPEVTVDSFAFDFSLDRALENGGKRLGTSLLHNAEGYLAARREEGTLVAWVRSRPSGVGNQYLSTTQTLVGTNPLVEEYTTAKAQLRAIKSYGALRHGHDMNFLPLLEMKALGKEGLPQPSPDFSTIVSVGQPTPTVETGHAPSPQVESHSAETGHAPSPQVESHSAETGHAPSPQVESHSAETGHAPSLHEGESGTAPALAGQESEALALVEKIKQNPQALALLKELLKE